MDKNNIPYHPLPEDACLSTVQLYGYIDGTLSHKEQHAVEKHLLDCGFCTEAFEGMELVKNRDKVAALPLAVIPEIEAEQTESKEKGRVIPLFRSGRTYAAAASLILLIGVTWYLNRFSANDSSKQLSDNNTNTTKEEIAPVASQSPAMADSTAKYQQADNKDELITVKTNKQPEPFSSENEDLAANKGITAVPEAPGVNTEGDNRQEKPTSDVEVAEKQKAETDKSFAQGKKSIAQDEQADYKKNLENKFTLRAEESAKEKEKTGPVLNNTTDALAVPLNEVTVTNACCAGNGSVSLTDSTKLVTTGGTFSAPMTTGGANYSWSGTATDSLTVVRPQMTNSGTVGYTMSSVETVSTTKDRSNLSLFKSDAAKKTSAKGNSAPAVDSNAPVKTDNTKYNEAIIEINNARNENALILLNEILKNPKSPLYDDAYWQKAVVLVKLNRKPEAKIMLQNIVKKGGKYKPLAESQLKQL